MNILHVPTVVVAGDATHHSFFQLPRGYLNQSIYMEEKNILATAARKLSWCRDHTQAHKTLRCLPV